MDTKAALASPTFTGTVTAPTVNATTDLTVNSVSVTTETELRKSFLL